VVRVKMLSKYFIINCIYAVTAAVFARSIPLAVTELPVRSAVQSPLITFNNSFDIYNGQKNYNKCQTTLKKRKIHTRYASCRHFGSWKCLMVVDLDTMELIFMIQNIGVARNEYKVHDVTMPTDDVIKCYKKNCKANFWRTPIQKTFSWQLWWMKSLEQNVHITRLKRIWAEDFFVWADIIFQFHPLSIKVRVSWLLINIVNNYR